MKTYTRLPCKVCGKLVSVNGAAWASHMKAHVRKGEAVETKNRGFFKYEATPEQPK